VFIDNRIPLHFSFPTERRFQRQLKKEPRWCGTIPLLAKVLDFDALARIYLTREWQSTLVSWPGRWVSRLVFSQAQMAPGEEIRVETSAQFTPEFDRFWREVCDKYPAMTVRDRAYLAWRYAPSPRRRFHILVARAQGRMVGYAVLGSKKLRGVKTGLIMELMVAEGASGEQAGSHLLAEAEDFFRAQKMAVIVGLMAPFADEYRILRRAGYRPVPEALAPRVFRFIFMLHETRDSDLLSLSVGDWYVTLSDYESF
jgi:GNAT superfamily N-acetyltransferase